MYKRILVPTDGSELSDRAITEAAGLAKAFHSDLLILHACEPYEPPLYSDGSAFYDKQHEANAEHDLLQAARKIASSKGVKARTTYVLDRSPYEAIIDKAKSSDCDLIVMASHGRKAIAALVIGSQTQKVLSNSTIPVLVVR